MMLYQVLQKKRDRLVSTIIGVLFLLFLFFHATDVVNAACNPGYQSPMRFRVHITAEDTGSTKWTNGTTCGGTSIDGSMTVSGTGTVGGGWACDWGQPGWETAVDCDQTASTTLGSLPSQYTCADTTWSVDNGASGTGCTATGPEWMFGMGDVRFTMALADQTPIGNHEPDPATPPSCNQITGWACDGDDFDETLDVKIYDGDSSGTLLATVPAGNLREAAVATACGDTGNSNHGFSWAINDTLKDGNDHVIHIYGVNIDQSGVAIGNDPLLTWSPHTINCIPDPWYKLQGASLYKTGAVNNFIPVLPQAYDTDDTADRFLVVRGTNPPRVTQEGVVLSGLNIYLGTGAQTSTSQWQRQNYIRSVGYLGNLTSFIEYAKLRKKFKMITSLGEMESNTINIFTGDLPTINNSNRIGASIINAVLLVNGTITLDINQFNPSRRSLALIATDAINITSNVRVIHGILIANQVDIASDVPTTTQELKIYGNLITTNDIDVSGLKRERTEWRQPSLFIQFDPNMYVDLLIPLSTIIQEGRTIE